MIFVATAVSVGCNTVPYTGRTQVMLVSKAQEKDFASRAWNEAGRKEAESKEQRYKEALERVGKNIAQAVNNPDCEWEFKVFDSDRPNAFCLPDGKVAVYTGLFKFVDNDAELAAVLAHEAAHSFARHGSEQISQGVLNGKGAEVLNATDTGTRQLLDMYGSATNESATLAYTAENEREADYIGLIFMAKAGYDPAAAIKFREKIEKVLNPGFKSHIGELEKRLPEAEIIYNQAPEKRGLGEVYSAAVHNPVFTAKPTAASESLLEKAGAAFKAGDKPRLKQVLADAESSVSLHPEDQKALVIYGKILALLNNSPETNLLAENVFAEAVRLDPEDDEARRYLADTLYRQELFNAAIEQLEQVLNNGHFIDPATIALLNMCYIRDEQYGRGINFLGQLAGKYPQKDDIKLQIAVLAHHWGNKPLAVNWLRQVIDRADASEANRETAEKLLYMNR